MDLRELVQTLWEVDPVQDYAIRASEAVARSVDADAWRLHLGTIDAGVGDRRRLASLSPQCLTLLSGRGKLWIYRQPRLSREEQERLRWAGGILSSALSIVERLQSDTRSQQVKIEQALAQTQLTAREREVARLLSRGESTHAIASAMKVTPLTVNTYLKRTYKKLGVHSRVELIAKLNGPLQNLV